MKLSEAIRLGAMMKPQIRGAIETDHGTCAYGAALDAVGKLQECRSVGLHISLGWGDPFELVNCPVCGKPFHNKAIGHLNDFHCWTREAIADWVESIENAQAAEATPAEATCKTTP